MTLTLSGFAGKTITGLTLSMRSNSKGGKGMFSMKAGTTTLAEIASNTPFNNAAWYGAWSTSYVDVTPTMSNTTYVIQQGENVIITISASVNSLYCQSFTISYTENNTHNVTISSGISNGTMTSNVANAAAGATVTLTASPEQGYELSELTVTTASQTIGLTQTSTPNVYTFEMPSEDVTVSATFAALQAHTVTLHEGSNTTTLTETYGGAGVTLPTANTVCANYTFAGWTKTPTTLVPDNFITAGGYTPTTDEDLYAVFQTLTGQNLTSTESTDVSSPNAYWTVDKSGETQSYWEIFQNNYIETPTLDLSTITSITVQMGTYGGTGKTLAIVNSADDTYFTKTPTNNVESTSYAFNASDASTSLSGIGKLKFECTNGTSDKGLRIKSISLALSTPEYSYTLTPSCLVATPTFSPAADTYNTAKDITLNCATEGATIEYVINPTTATPTYQTYTQPIQLSENGTYNIVVRATKQGMMDSETDTAQYVIDTSAIIVQPTVTFNAGTGTCETTSLTGDTITLPTATPATLCASAEGFAFAGWSTSAVTETTTRPTLLTGQYIPSADTTLYAVYSKTVNIPDTNFHKVTSVPTTWAGSYLIVCESSNVAFDGSLTELAPKITNSGNKISITHNNGIILADATNTRSTFTISQNGTKYNIQSKSGFYVGQNTNNTGISATQNPSPLSNYDNTLNFSADNVDFAGNGGAHLRYNSDGSKFSYYQSSRYASYSPIQLYKQGGCTSSVVYNSNPVCHETVATPVISVASGTYDDAQGVVLTCATDGAEIRYTLDGSEPTETSTLYSGLIQINTSCTLSAKAFKTDCYASEIVASTYDLPVFVNSIADFKTAGAADNTQRYRINNSLTVTYASGSNIYVQDATGGLLVYTNGQTLPALSTGSVFGYLIGKYTTYMSTPEIKLTSVPYTLNQLAIPTEHTISFTEFTQNFDRYESDLIRFSDIHFTETNTYTTGTTGATATLIDANGSTAALYNTFKTLNLTLKKDHRAAIVGIAKAYRQSTDTTYEICPRDNHDIFGYTIYGDTLNITECDSYTWSVNQTEYTTSGLKSCIVPDRPVVGFDSVAVINLTIGHANTGDTTASACGSFTWHDITYTETPAANPTFTMQNRYGCDSVVALHLTINQEPSITISTSSSHDYICNGENITLTADGATPNDTLINESFSTCTGNEGTAIGNNALSNFPTVSKVFPAGGNVKLGSGSYIGSLTSKTLNLSNPFIVTVNAKKYDNEAGPITVTVGNQTQSISNLTNEYTDYTLSFNAADANSKVTIATTTAAKRAYIGHVMVIVKGDDILWSTNETTPSIEVSPSTTTNYEVVIADRHNCTGYAAMNITVYPQPVAQISGAEYDTLCAGNTKVFTANDDVANNNTYQWYKNNTQIVGATGRELRLENVTGEMSGAYTVVVTNPMGTCKDSSAAAYLLVNAPGASDYNFAIVAEPDIYDTIRIGYCDVTHAFANPTVNHFLSNTRFGNVTFTHNGHNPYNVPGDYPITWVGTDGCGNTATCSQVLHISYEPCPIAVDNEGNQYPSVRINCECWITQNLRSTRYSDGSTISSAMTYSCPEYPDTIANAAIYGRLYDWNSTVAAGNAALNTPNGRGHIQGVCPAGWYLPTMAHMMGLAGPNSNYGISDHRTTEYWLTAGSNSTQLSLVPGGQYNSSNGRFENIGGNSYFWDAYSYNASTARTFEADCHCYRWKVTDSNAGMGYSVRCIKERER